MSKKDRDVGAARPGIGLFGAAERAPLTQGKDGSGPLVLEGDDLTAAPAPEREMHGEPVESDDVPSPIAEHVERRPVATGEETIEEVDPNRTRGSR